MQFWKIVQTHDHEEKIKVEKRRKYSKELSNLYQETLHRKIDKKGLKYFLSLLMDDEITIDAIRDEMMNSQEYFEKIVLDKDNIPKPLLRESKKIISNMYKETLNRKPDRRVNESVYGVNTF